MRARTRTVFALVLLSWILPASLGAIHSPQALAADARAQNASQEPADAEAAKVHPGPQDIKERIAIYVFLGWLWLSILVLIYLLRLKIRESDRLNNFAYFDTDNVRGTTPPGT